jgi:hypothetical protein
LRSFTDLTDGNAQVHQWLKRLPIGAGIAKPATSMSEFTGPPGLSCRPPDYRQRVNRR